MAIAELWLAFSSQAYPLSLSVCLNSAADVPHCEKIQDCPLSLWADICCTFRWNGEIKLHLPSMSKYLVIQQGPKVLPLNASNLYVPIFI